jgi:hypothetical protein
VKLLVEKLPPMDVAIYAGVSLEVMQDRYLHAKTEHTRHVVGVVSDDVRALPEPVKAIAGSVMDEVGAT